MEPTFYEILDVPTNASNDEIRRAYKQKALETHPDKLEPGVSTEIKQEAEKKFHQVYEAFEVLSDPDKRKAYDFRMNISAHHTSRYESEEVQRRMRDRAEWARQQAESHRAKMERIREQNRLAREEMRVRVQEAAEEARMVAKMVDELCKLQPEWEARKISVQKRREDRLGKGVRHSIIQS